MGDFCVTDQPSANTKLRSPRKNLLLSATIEAGHLKAPVRIRNLSETGAMLDGAALPDVGTSFTLRRLEIEIGATVVWASSGRCGVAFDGKVSVEDWVAGVRQTASTAAGDRRRGSCARPGRRSARRRS